MKIYLDYIFLENLVINVIIFLETIKLIKVRIKLKKIILFSIFNSIISCLCIIFSLNSYIFSFCITVFSLYLFIKENNIIKILKSTLIYYLIYFIYLGTVFFFAITLNCNLDILIIKLGLYIFCGIILDVLTNTLWKMWKIKLTNETLYYYLIINGVKILAFVDTGNTVKDPLTNLDVIFIDKKYKNVILNNHVKREHVKILVSSINCESYIEGYVVKNVEIYNKERKVAEISKIIISFELNNTQEKYSGIIGYDTYLEYLEGVVL